MGPKLAGAGEDWRLEVTLSGAWRVGFTSGTGEPWSASGSKPRDPPCPPTIGAAPLWSASEAALTWAVTVWATTPSACNAVAAGPAGPRSAPTGFWTTVVTVPPSVPTIGTFVTMGALTTAPFASFTMLCVAAAGSEATLWVTSESTLVPVLALVPCVSLVTV